jgi:hypothetical protein
MPLVWRRDKIERVVYVAALILFIFCLFEPAVSVSKNPFRHLDCANPDKESGWLFLLTGPLGILIGQFGWFANPLMILTALPLRKSLKVLFTIVAIALATTSLTLTYIPNDVDGNMVCGFEPGLYVWLACPVLMLIAACLKR